MELTIWAHEASDPEVYVDPALSNASEGDVSELWVPQASADRDHNGASSRSRFSARSEPTNLRNAAQANRNQQQQQQQHHHHRGERRNLYFHIKKPKVTKSTSLPTISVSSTVLGILGIRPRSQVKVRVLKPHQLKKTESDVVEVHFKGVYSTRNDHYRIGKSINGRCVHSGQRIKYLNDSTRLTVEVSFRGGKKKFSGVIGEDTRSIFRSDSARISIFIHMTAEMWNFDETGDIMFHRLVNSFIPEMLHKWHDQGDSHLVSLVLFTSVSENAFSKRNYESNGKSKSDSESGNLRAGVLEKETHNFYRVVVDSTPISRWSDIMSTLRYEFERFPKEVLEDPETHEIRGYFLPSSKSNILEALSLATTLLTSKFVDRDLCRTGVQAMVATAGQACFDVDLSDLWQSSRRLLGVEIGIELVCLARPPLHVTPLFRALLNNEGENRSIEPFRSVFVVPKWINMSFWSTTDRNLKQWIPRCRIYDSQTVSLIDNDAKYLGLKSFGFEPNEINSKFMRHFDANVFKSVEMIESQRKIEMTAKTANSLESRPRNNSLHERSTAMAITTKALATPTVTITQSSSPASGGESTPPSPTVSFQQSRNFSNKFASLRPSIASFASSNNYNTHNHLHSETSTIRSVHTSSAKQTSGALLKTYGDATKKSSPNNNGLNNSNGDLRQNTPQNSHNSVLDHQSNSFESEAIADTHHLSSSDSPPNLNAPIYIETPAYPERRDSKVGRASLKSSSSLGRHSGTSSWGHRSYGASPDHDKFASRSPNMGDGATMCDTSHPELETTSMWRVLPNPAVVDNPSRVTAYGRWANVYPPKIRIDGVSWHSSKSPASLPITSESFATLAAFKEQYKFQFYDVAVDSEEISLPQLLDEMIGLRSQMGFQIAVGPSIRAVEASFPRGNPNRVVAIVPRDSKECIGVRVYMTRIGLIHRLAVDDDRLINVRLYTWIERNAKRLSCAANKGRHEEVKVKTKYGDRYQNINKRFLDLGVERSNWSMLDQQVSGADDPLLYPSSANTQSLITIRYVLSPTAINNVPGHDTSTAEEGRVEGITRMVRTLLRHREAGSIDSDFIVHYYTGTLSKAIGEIVSDSSSSLEANRLNKSISLADLAGEMQGAMGLRFRDRRWHWKHFKQVFTGHDFVIWLLKTFEDINTTEDAELYGADSMKRGSIRHPEDRHPFLHGHYFYALTPEYQNKHGSETSSINESSDDGIISSGLHPSMSSGTNTAHGNDSSGSGSGKGSDSTKPSASGNSSNSKSEKSNSYRNHETARAKVHVSDSFVINVDPRKISGRPERAKVSIDRVHNPKNAFHIIVEWLSATPRLVDDLFSGIGRMVSQYGLRLVQVPITDVSGSIEDSPFRSSMILELNVDTKDDAELRWFRHYLSSQAGYVSDIHDRRDITNDQYEVLFLWGKLRSAASQYIHNSGYVLAQVADERHLYVTANTSHVSRAVLAGNSTISADGQSEIIMDQSKALCSDKERLESMLVEARLARHQKHGGASGQVALTAIKSEAAAQHSHAPKHDDK